MRFKRKLNASPEFLTTILQNMNSGILSCDTDFNVTFSNRRIQEIYGIPLNVPSENWQSHIEFYEADGITPVAPNCLPLVRAINGETVIDSYNVIKHKNNNNSRLIKNNAHPIYDSNGKITGAILTTEDSQDLAQSLSRFKAIFDQSPLSIQILNKEGRTILVNAAYQKMWNISDELLNNYVLKEYNILKDKVLEEEGAQSLIKQAFSGEIVHIPEFFYDPQAHGLPGRSRWSSGVVYPLKNTSGEVHEVVIIHEDTTDKKTAVEERELMFAQLKAIVRQMPAGVMVIDKNEEILLYNEQMTKLIGNPSTAKEVFAPSLQRSMQGDVIKSNEQNYTRADGLVSVFETSFGPIKNPQGNVFASVLISNDITNEKRAESNQAFLTHVKTLLISTLDYEQILERIANSAIPYLADGCMVDILEGPEIRRIVTKHRDPQIQSHMNELKNQFPPRFGSPQPTMQTIQTGKASLITTMNQADIARHTYNSDHAELISKIGIKSHMSIPLNIRGKIIGAINIFNSGNRVDFNEKDFIIAQELGRCASVAIDNAALYKDAKSAVQLRDDFISIASHELRTPITSLHLQIEVLNSLASELDTHPEIGQVMKKFLGNTNVQLKRLTRLVDDMLDISRITAGKLTLNIKKVNLTGLTLDVLDRFKDHLDSQNINVTFNCASDVYYHCDPERIDQVITNFMTNAIRYGNKKPIQIQLEESVENVVYKIQDNGRGIDKLDQERIFKRFERAHTCEDVSGLGLGLYINNKIIDEHGGKIKIESELNSGSTFIVLLPKT